MRLRERDLLDQFSPAVIKTCFVVMGLLSYLPLLPAEHAAAATQPANHPVPLAWRKQGASHILGAAPAASSSPLFAWLGGWLDDLSRDFWASPLQPPAQGRVCWVLLEKALGSGQMVVLHPWEGCWRPVALGGLLWVVVAAGWWWSGEGRGQRWGGAEGLQWEERVWCLA